MKTYTKETLIDELLRIRDMGWVPCRRQGNVGSVGNTLEDLLEIQENNLPIPNAAEWELKCQRIRTNSLVTLFHSEPSPRAMRFVPNILLPYYGWPHQEAGKKYIESEMSFRQTINAVRRSDRGFMVQVNNKDRKIEISFDAKEVALHHKTWLDSVSTRIGLSELNPQPYWGFDDLFHIAGTKLLNTFYIEADTKRVQNQTYFHYKNITILQGFNLENFIRSIESGEILVDFDARTGHNHGTKFRTRKNNLPNLYADVRIIE